jgi:hypothetical protein
VFKLQEETEEKIERAQTGTVTGTTPLIEEMKEREWSAATH